MSDRAESDQARDRCPACDTAGKGEHGRHSLICPNDACRTVAFYTEALADV